MHANDQSSEVNIVGLEHETANVALFGVRRIDSL
jgi:hypothetical protein